MDPIDHLLSLERFGIKLGLQNIQSLCEALGQPHRVYRSILVAGTNGKGSLTAMVDTALRAAGHRTACYTSPHLVRLEERFVIDGRPVAEETLRREAAAMRDLVERLQRHGKLTTQPTFFEMTTAIAFELFRRAGIQVALLEVGMGGRFDATNVATPLAVAITSIDLDHQRHLGSTIRDIAFEKAGVIKAGTVVVLGETKPEAVEVFDRVCRERGARLVRAQDRLKAGTRMRDGRVHLSLSTPARQYGELPLSLRGSHQANNAIVAVRLLEELDALGVPVPTGAVVRGLTDTVWRGRLELLKVDDRHQVLLDAAHNPAAAEALATYLREVYPGGLPLVFAAMSDKDIPGMLTALRPCVTRLVCTAPRTPRAVSALELAAQAGPIVGAVPVEAEPEVWTALERAWTAGATACATGSIFLIGEILDALERRGGKAPD